MMKVDCATCKFAQLVWAAVGMVATQTLLFWPAAALAESGFLSQKRTAGNRTAGSSARPTRGGVLQLNNADLTSYIATGVLPGTVVHALRHTSSLLQDQDMGKQQAGPSDEGSYDSTLASHDAKISILHEYEQRLLKVKTAAENAQRAVQEQEAKLNYNFHPIQKTLVALIDHASETASKAEVETLKQRLARIHFQQLRALDRSAAYWNSQVYENKKLADKVEAEAKKAQLNVTSTEFIVEREAQKLKLGQQKEKQSLEMWKKMWEASLEQSEAQQIACEHKENLLRKQKLEQQRQALVDEVWRRAEDELGVKRPA